MQFSQSEKRGFFILLAALAAVIISLIIRPLVIKRQSEKVDFGDFEKSISQYQDSIINNLDSNDFRYFANNNRNRSFGRKINPFTFDPNTLSVEGWMKLGYSQNRHKPRKNTGREAAFSVKKTT